MPGYLIEDTFKLNQLGDTLVLRSGDDKLDFTKYYTATGEAKLTNNDTVARSVIKGFVKADKVAGSDITPDTLEETIKITGVQHNYKTEKLSFNCGFIQFSSFQILANLSNTRASSLSYP